MGESAIDPPAADKWLYPPDLKGDLLDTPLPPRFVDETLTTAWEYTRCVIPAFTNRARYMAFVRLIAVTTVAEYYGCLVDVVNTNTGSNPNSNSNTNTNTNEKEEEEITMILNYNITALLQTLFDNDSTPPKIQSLMSREFRTNLLFAADKSCPTRRKSSSSSLFRRYVNLLGGSGSGGSGGSGDGARRWFRLRDCDGLARFTILAAVVCNGISLSSLNCLGGDGDGDGNGDLSQNEGENGDGDENKEEEGSCCFTEPQLEILAELSLTMYDAVAYYKHRAEGEVCNTFAYACGAGTGTGSGDDGDSDRIRKEAYHRCREVLWGLDAFYLSSSPSPSSSSHDVEVMKMQCAINFVRYFGGPIHMMMRRYRFVNDELTIGKPETEEIIGDARRHVKLWNRVDMDADVDTRNGDEAGDGDGASLVDVDGSDNEDDSRYAAVVAQGDRLLIPGLLDLLEREGEEGRCRDCKFRDDYGAEAPGEFGGVRLCLACRLGWQEYLGSLTTRAVEAFPVLQQAGLGE